MRFVQERVQQEPDRESFKIQPGDTPLQRLTGRGLQLQRPTRLQANGIDQQEDVLIRNSRGDPGQIGMFVVGRREDCDTRLSLGSRWLIALGWLCTASVHEL